MNLENAINELELPVNGDEVYVHNSWTDSIPTVIQGNGSGKVKRDYVCLGTTICFFFIEKFELFK
jgi:hypothetical protein